MKIINVGDGRTLKTYFRYLEEGGIIRQIRKTGREFDSLEKPEKIYLNNTNQLYALSAVDSINPGTVRETFFAERTGGGGDFPRFPGKLISRYLRSHLIHGISDANSVKS